jgi:hypothetical protein
MNLHDYYKEISPMIKSQKEYIIEEERKLQKQLLKEPDCYRNSIVIGMLMIGIFAVCLQKGRERLWMRKNDW